jgi:hypothetical protein
VREIDGLLPELSERLFRAEIIARLRYEAEAADSSAKRMLRRGGDESAQSAAHRPHPQFLDSRFAVVRTRRRGPGAMRNSSRATSGPRPVVSDIVEEAT